MKTTSPLNSGQEETPQLLLKERVTKKKQAKNLYTLRKEEEEWEVEASRGGEPVRRRRVYKGGDDGEPCHSMAEAQTSLN